MVTTIILCAAGVLVTFTGAPNPVVILLGVMLAAIAFGRATVWRKVDNRPVSRDELRGELLDAMREGREVRPYRLRRWSGVLADLADWWQRR